MSYGSASVHAAPRNSRRRKVQHHVIIAKGDRVRSFVFRPRLIAFGMVTLIALAGGGVAFGVNALLEQQNSLLQQASDGAQAAQGSLRQSYEQRIAEMSRQIDSLVSRQLVERSTIEQQMDALAERQDALNQRQQLLTGLTNEAIQAGIDVLPALAPIPVPNPLRGPPDVNAAAAPIDPITTGAVTPADGFNPLTQIEEIANAAAVVEYDQMAALDAIADAVEERTDAIADALATLGYRNPDRGTGGPFVAADPDHEDFNEVAGELQAFANLVDYARTLPLGQPIPVLDITSGYGTRRDPFLGQTAMHTGIDFAAMTGTQVRATGPGTVTFAGVNGGYGKMVEIDHGNGMSTRYAHLSSISVRVGQVVEAGDTVARSGSTGRSTGPHLHYEMLRNGRTIDPAAHLRTGATIRAML